MGTNLGGPPGEPKYCICYFLLVIYQEYSSGCSGLIQLGGGWYMFLTDMARTWQGSREACYSLGATLIAFNSQNEIDVIHNHITNSSKHFSTYIVFQCVSLILNQTIINFTVIVTNI